MNNKCVYLHKLNGEVVYVGSGAELRVISKTSRTEEHLNVWPELEFEIVKTGLSDNASRLLERELIQEHWNSGKLFNKTKDTSLVKELNYEEVDAHFNYDEAVFSCLTRKKSLHPGSKVGSIAGSFNNSGYIQVKFKNKVYLAHRIVWVLHNKRDIDSGFVIDHIDCDKANSKIGNLRCVSQSDNNRNKSHKITNTGYQGLRELLDKRSFKVTYRDIKQITVYFSYANGKKSTNPARQYPTRELALEAALAYRNSLVDQGLIILTNKEELNGSNTRDDPTSTL